MKRMWIALAVLVPMLLGVQHFGLERTREKQAEDRFTRIADVKATRILPQYIASLFMGSFRAIIVDILWVQLRRLREEEHRFFEMVEIMDMIGSLQPRNPEVWVHQAWNAAYNIANHVRDKDEQWTWIRYALEKLKEGTDQMPGDPYLKFELGRTLVHKATWREGFFADAYMASLEREQLDPKSGFKSRIWRGEKTDRPLSPFELAIPWFEQALDDLAKARKEKGWQNPMTGQMEDKDWWTTQVGLNIHPSTIDGNIYLAKYFQAWWEWTTLDRAEVIGVGSDKVTQSHVGRLVQDGGSSWSIHTGGKSIGFRKRPDGWIVTSATGAESRAGDVRFQKEWKRGRPEEAARWFRAAAEHARRVLDRYQPRMLIYKDYLALTEKLVVMAENPARTLEEKERMLALLSPALEASGLKDYNYLYEELSAIKKELGGDAFEFNDGLEQVKPVDFERVYSATLVPAGDVDQYFGVVRAPDEPVSHEGHAHEPGEEHDRPAFPPHRVGFQVKKDGDVDLKVELWTFKKRLLQPWGSIEVRGNRWEEIEGITDTAGHFVLRVQALDPAARGQKPAYLLRWSLGEIAR